MQQEYDRIELIHLCSNQCLILIKTVAPSKQYQIGYHILYQISDIMLNIGSCKFFNPIQFLDFKKKNSKPNLHPIHRAGSQARGRCQNSIKMKISAFIVSPVCSVQTPPLTDRDRGIWLKRFIFPKTTFIVSTVAVTLILFKHLL